MDDASDGFAFGHQSRVEEALAEWRAILQTPEQAAPEEAIRKAEERLTISPLKEIGLPELVISTEQNVADADRELDESFEYLPQVPRGDKKSTQLLVWKVQVGDKVAYVGERSEVTSLYLAAATKAEAFAMATRILRHPETPYPASWAPHIARELVDKPVDGPLAVQDDELVQDDLVPEPVEDEEDPGPL